MEKEDEHSSEPAGLGILRVWRDDQARCAAMNMALDEVMLREMNESSSQLPILRFYDWARPAISIGYFQRWQDTVSEVERAELDWVRRWTGGGRVDHRVDQTYTLVLTRDHPLFYLTPAENYRWVHRCVVQALSQWGAQAVVSDTQQSFSPRGDHSALCFEHPVQFDVVDASGEKLAGAAQRRTRWGLLHQGSVVEPGLAENREAWQAALAQGLSGAGGEVIAWQPPEAWQQQAEKLAEEKYAQKSWQEKF
ncbi:MAG: hypothetical protein L3J39_05215 [Verrucomicrobiales bacterium]|nr:hypothetical protein [Verrucomicrobiales bacterium]